MSRKHKAICTTLNYIEHFFVFAGCITIFAFASLFGISIRITSSAIGLKICTIEKVIHKIKKKKKKHG